MANLLSDVVKCVEGEAGLSRLEEMLAALARWSGSMGCIVWEPVPTARRDHADPNERRVFPRAQWFSDKSSWHKIDVPVGSSLTGLAIVSKTRQVTRDALTDSRTFHDDPWLADVGPACVFPLTLRDQLTGDSTGAITFYRARDREAFSEEELDELEGSVRLLPVLSQAIRNRVAFHLLHEVDKLLEKPQSLTDTPNGCEKKIQQVTEQVGSMLREAFGCREVRIFVKVAHNERGPYLRRVPPDGLKPVEMADEGVDAWTIRTRRSALILDLNRWQRDLRFLQEEYPDLTEPDLKKEANRTSGERQKDTMYVVSQIAAPMMTPSVSPAEQVMGTIICSDVEHEPRYFSMRELKLVELVASRLGSYIDQLRQYDNLRREQGTWRDLVKTVETLNAQAGDGGSGTDPGSDEFIQQSAREIQRLLGMVDSAKVYWSEDSPKAEDIVKNSMLQALGLAKSLEVSAEKTEQLRRFRGEGALNRKVQHMVLAQVACGRRLGVLMLGSFGDQFPSHSKYVAEVLGDLLGLYRVLGLKMRETDRARIVQAQAFADLRHQIRSPLVSVLRFVMQILPANEANDRLRRRLNAIRGLTSQSLSVANCVGLYADLAYGSPPNLKLNPLSVSQLRQKLIEAAMDHEVIYAESKGLSFVVDRESLDALAGYTLNLDLALYLQCVNNLLENAGKYSFAKTPVHITASIVGRRFVLSVINKGIELSKDDAIHCVERNWRSEYVKTKIRDTGHGIGLWIVNEVMKAHRGTFEPVPTTTSLWTEFRLIVPLEKSS